MNRKEFIGSILLKMSSKEFIIESIFLLLIAFVLICFLFLLLSLNLLNFINLYATKGSIPVALILNFIAIIVSVIFLMRYYKKISKIYVWPIFIIVLSISLFLLFLLISYLINEQTIGTNDKPINAIFNIFVVDDALTKKEVSNYISESNKIWNKYNISIVSGNISFVESNKINLTKNETLYLFQKGNNDEECKNYSKILNKITGNKSTGSFIIFMDGEGNNAGRGSLCNYKFALVSQEIFIKDLTGWVTAHEIGHALGAGADMKGKDRFEQNLMNDEYKIIEPSFLSQSQLEKVVNESDRLMKNHSRS